MPRLAVYRRPFKVERVIRQRLSQTNEYLHEQSKDEEQGKTGEDDNSEDQRIVRIFVCLLRVDLADDFDLESLALLYLEAILGDKEIVGPEGHEHIVCINWVR